jgi:hypothetical protein
MLTVYGVLLITVTVGTGVAALSWLSSTSQDHLAVIANFLTLGTLLLALIAGIIALAAYSAATGLPDLKLQFTLSTKGYMVIPNNNSFYSQDSDPLTAAQDMPLGILP